MIRRLAALLSRWSARWVPDPFVIAILLTLFTVGLVWLTTGDGPLEAIGNWGGRLDGGELLGRERGLWSLLTFGMQICLTLVTGHALANAPPLRRAIAGLVDRIPSAGAAIVVVALVAMTAGLLNWGLGLIVGALVARDMGRSLSRRRIPVHYPLLGAAGYTGLMVWHGGLSGSAPLKITSASEIASVLPPGVHLDPVPLSQTIGGELNLVVTALLLTLVPLLLVLMRPRSGELRPFEDFSPSAEDPAPRPAPTTPAQRLERSSLLALALAAMIFTYLVMLTDKTGLDRVGLSTINLLFLGLGLALHADPKGYADAIGEGARSCAGVILQFPFYAGIMGMMALSGLMSELAATISAAATPDSFGPLTFLAAGTVNLFVPSGGGQFAVQGPLVVDVAHQLGVPMGKAIMAFSYGDEWTNMLQPFWALPLLGITGLKVGDLIGYTAALMLLAAPIFLIPLVLF